MATALDQRNRARPGILDVVLPDSFGRIATDRRASVTDRCNLRCSYCMPAEGLDWLPGPALLTDGEMARLIAIAVQQLGITEVRFTGGEPLLPVRQGRGRPARSPAGRSRRRPAGRHLAPGGRCQAARHGINDHGFLQLLMADVSDRAADRAARIAAKDSGQ